MVENANRRVMDEHGEMGSAASRTRIEESATINICAAASRAHVRVASTMDGELFDVKDSHFLATHMWHIVFEERDHL